MAIFDWNHNGKKDLADDFIEYQIYKDVMGEDNETSKNSKPHKSHFNSAKTTDGKDVSGEDLNGGVVVAALLIAILAFILLFEAIKAESGIISFILVIFGLAVAIFGKWLLMGKRVIKKEAKKNMV